MKPASLLATILFATALSAGTVARALAQDPLQVAPTMYKLVFENDRVRVLEVTLKAGEKIARHSHPDHFGYVLGAGKLKISKPDGTSIEPELKTGEVVWIAAETHEGENMGETELRVLVVELKEPAPKPKKTKPAAKK